MLSSIPKINSVTLFDIFARFRNNKGENHI